MVDDSLMWSGGLCGAGQYHAGMASFPGGAPLLWIHEIVYIDFLRAPLWPPGAALIGEQADEFLFLTLSSFRRRSRDWGVPVGSVPPGQLLSCCERHLLLSKLGKHRRDQLPWLQPPNTNGAAFRLELGRESQSAF